MYSTVAVNRPILKISDISGSNPCSNVRIFVILVNLISVSVFLSVKKR